MHPALSALLITLPALAGASAHAAQCSAQSGANAPLVVELYTSEGCNSCPPADRWLSQVQGRADVIALAFHVDYWDRLGWKDRYASPAWTQRQYEVSARSGASFVYTPQVLVGGRDYRRWPALPATAAAPVALSLVRDGDAYLARVTHPAGTPRALSGYWAVTEDGHVSQIKAGENHGKTLTHDAVVRELLPVEAIGDEALRFTPKPADAGAASRRVQFVVTDPRSGLPLQALALRC